MMFCAEAGRRPAGRGAGRSISTIRRIVLVGLAVALGALLWSGGDASAQRYGGGTGGTSSNGDSGGTSGGGGSPTGGGGQGPSGGTGGGRSNGGGSGGYRPYEQPGRFGGGPYGGGDGDGWSGRRYFPGGGYGRYGGGGYGRYGGGYGGYGPYRGYGRGGGYGRGDGRFGDGDRYDDGGPGPERRPRRPRPPYARDVPYGPRDPGRNVAPPVRYVAPHPSPVETVRPADAAPERTKAPPVLKAARPVAPKIRVAAPPPVRPIVPPAAPSRPPPAASAAIADKDHVPDEVLLELRPNQPDSTMAAVAAQFRLTRIAAQRIDLLDTTVYRYRVPAGRSAASLVQALRGDRRVALAQLNGKYRLQADDAGAPKPGGSAPPPMQWSVDKLQLPAVHDVTTGRDVLIAMIDSGVDAAHPELTGGGVSLLDTLDSPFVPHEHGTAIAGALLAHGQLTGVAPGARILGIRTFDAKASEMGAEGTSIHIAKALDLAERAKARVLNLSFAGPQDDLLARMFAALHRKGVVIVAAAGNAGPHSPPLYPAADPNVIAVTATDAKDALYGSANRGSYICIAAPGVDILEPAPDASYQFTSGTSVAAAHVSGVVALLLARDPDLDPDAVRKALVETADLLGSGASPEEFGSGLVDAVRAVHRFDPALPAVRSAKAPDAPGAAPAPQAAAPPPQVAAPAPQAADQSDDIPVPKP